MAENNFGLFFTRDSLVIRLPVNPAKLPEERDTDNGSYNVLGIGPVTVPRIPKQREIVISSWFPGRAFPGVLTAGGFKPPEFYIGFFHNAMIDRVPILYTPVRYYENGEPFMTGDTGFQVLVTQFKTEERGGETGDFYYDLTLTEYRDYAPKSVQLKQETGGVPDMSQNGQTVSAAAEPTREMPAGQLAVGVTAVANGPWYASSYGDEPHGNGNGRTVKVSRMVDASRAYPVHVTTPAGGPLGWMKADALQAVRG